MLSPNTTFDLASKTAIFSLKSLSLTLPRAVTIYPQTTPTFGRTQTTIPFEREAKNGDDILPGAM